MKDIFLLRIIYIKDYRDIKCNTAYSYFHLMFNIGHHSMINYLVFFFFFFYKKYKNKSKTLALTAYTLDVKIKKKEKKRGTKKKRNYISV